MVDSSGRTAGADIDILALVRSWVVFTIFMFFFVGLSPFADISTVNSTDLKAGHEVFVYLATFGLTLIAALLMPKGSWQALGVLLRPINIVIIGWLFGSVIVSIDMTGSIKRLTISLAVLALAIMTPLLSGSVRTFARLLFAAVACVLIICYVGVLLAPEFAIHQVHDPLEPHLFGSWRGLYLHKNTAAAAMGLIILSGIFIARSGLLLPGIVTSVVAAIFLAFTLGKSTSVLIVVVIALTIAVVYLRSLWVKLALVFGPLVLLNFLAFGSVLSPTAKSILGTLPIDATFTGRTDVWELVLESIGTRPITGWGFQAFWYSEAARMVDDKTWATGASDSHNSYADLALTIGIPGLLLICAGFLVAPLVDFHNRLRFAANETMAAFLLSVWLFAIYLASFETFFFARADIVWFTLAMAVCGLRLLRFFRLQD